MSSHLDVRYAFVGPDRTPTPSAPAATSSQGLAPFPCDGTGGDCKGGFDAGAFEGALNEAGIERIGVFGASADNSEG